MWYSTELPLAVLGDCRYSQRRRQMGSSTGRNQIVRVCTPYGGRRDRGRAAKESGRTLVTDAAGQDSTANRDIQPL
ncbi:conserved hypothetical protein [Coccidioides posadasii str. Silveira]|uniref:Uncharacterized protein n=1 Tax=Coccidioides posadasii (strain RMSCC 757 / Silveira) TaxID=443226 RepID=E9DDA7_COCPS|nr:conserved hypothetical protein [Coccidioides posadasii str. Silveira]